MIIVKAGSDNAFEISINRNITFPLKYLKIIVTKKKSCFFFTTYSTFIDFVCKVKQHVRACFWDHIHTNRFLSDFGPFYMCC